MFYLESPPTYLPLISIYLVILQLCSAIFSTKNFCTSLFQGFVEAATYAMAAVLQYSTSHGLSFEPISQEVPRIRSNEGDYVEQNSLGWMRPTQSDTTLDEMWRRFEDDGYLLIKGLIPRQDVLDMREQ